MPADSSTHQQSAECDADTPARRKRKPTTHRKHSDERRKGKVRNFERRCIHAAILAVLLKPSLRRLPPAEQGIVTQHNLPNHGGALAPRAGRCTPRTTARTILWIERANLRSTFSGSATAAKRGRGFGLAMAKVGLGPIAQGCNQGPLRPEGGRAGSRLQLTTDTLHTPLSSHRSGRATAVRLITLVAQIRRTSLACA